MPIRFVSALSAAVGMAFVLGAGSTGTDAASGCRLRLPPPRAGEPRFVVPAGGRSIARTLADRIVLCTLLRADGSTFANARVDRLKHVLEIRFFRVSGTLLMSADAAYPAFPREQGAEVSCGSPANNSIGHGYWRKTIRWKLGRTPSGIPRSQVVGALRAAQAEWTNNVNWCRYPDRSDGFALYEGSTAVPFGHNGTSTVEWGRINNTQNCSGALACTTTWYDAEGAPVESDVCFTNAARWSVRPDARAFDIQTVAAHEFGHVRQFGHVTSEKLRQYTLVMWPYFTRGDISGRRLGRGDSLADNSHY